METRPNVIPNMENREMAKNIPPQVDINPMSETNSVPYDMVPLPSKGKCYPNKKTNIKVSYLTASDEDILMSPHLLKTGEFIDVLLSRKILDRDINPKDFLLGDRNAVIIWLRATGYGEMYPVKLTDPNTGEEFETEVDLTTLKMKELQIDPDTEGLFSFTLPKTNANIKFKLLTTRDEDEIIKSNEEYIKKRGVQYNRALIYRLERQIVELNGERDKGKISQFIQVMPAYDSLAFRTHVDKIEPGMDLKISVRTPGGESITSFLPLDIGFLWPYLRV